MTWEKFAPILNGCGNADIQGCDAYQASPKQQGWAALALPCDFKSASSIVLFPTTRLPHAAPTVYQALIPTAIGIQVHH
jgi:hypothetical protein